MGGSPLLKALVGCGCKCSGLKDLTNLHAIFSSPLLGERTSVCFADDLVTCVSPAYNTNLPWLGGEWNESTTAGEADKIEEI